MDFIPFHVPVLFPYSTLPLFLPLALHDLMLRNANNPLNFSIYHLIDSQDYLFAFRFLSNIGLLKYGMVARQCSCFTDFPVFLKPLEKRIRTNERRHCSH